jgi:hypothetical protein
MFYSWPSASSGREYFFGRMKRRSAEGENPFFMGWHALNRTPLYYRKINKRFNPDHL